MMTSLDQKRTLPYLFVYIPLGISILGSVALIVLHLFYQNASLRLVPELVAAYANVPLDTISLGFTEFSLETQNHLLFQVFESLPPTSFPHTVQSIGILFWGLFTAGIILASFLKKYPFILLMGLAIFLLVVADINAMNIGGLHSNRGLIIAFLGMLMPAIIIHTFYPYLSFSKRTGIIAPVALATWGLLIYFSPEDAPTLLLAENSSLLALSVAALFLAYIGHAAISNLYVFLAKLNQGIGIKIVWHFCVLSVLYLVMVGLFFLKVTGEANLGIPLPPLFVLFIVVALLGYFETTHKTKYMSQPYADAFVGKGLYVIGFSFTIWAWFKADLTGNAPMTDFLQHLFVYFQLGFGLLFFLYLIANFLGVVNSGTAIEKIMYKPPFFPYYHMRLGAFLTALVLAIYADVVVMTQWSTASTNLSADYYYALQRHREAAILYENSFERYRHNPKTLNAVAHIHFGQREPTAAINTLTESFSQRPNVPDIILLSSRLYSAGKPFEALFYLQEGLTYFPNNPYLANNLAILSSHINQPTQSLDLLQRMDGKGPIRNANLTALEALHHLGIPEQDLRNNLIGNVNLLANHNLRGDLAPFFFPTDTIRSGSLLNRAVLRNQWTNSPKGAWKSDIAQVDSIAKTISIPSVVAELTETRAIRSYQERQIDDLLATLGILAYNYPNSAGFYHSFEAKILMSQMDIEKAAEAWVKAEEKGFADIGEEHLSILYFGGKGPDADIIAQKYGLDYPGWMSWGPDRRLIENDTVYLIRGLAKLIPGLGSEALAPLESIKDPNLKAFYAQQLLLRKAHWYGDADLSLIVQALPREYGSEEERALTQYLMDNIKHRKLKDRDAVNAVLSENNPKNAYLTPLIMTQVEQVEDNLEKYNILHEASRLNKDPLLWIELVKYSRILGLDQYASSYLSTMGGWIDPDDLIELQLKYF